MTYILKLIYTSQNEYIYVYICSNLMLKVMGLRLLNVQDRIINLGTELSSYPT